MSRVFGIRHAAGDITGPLAPQYQQPNYIPSEGGKSPICQIRQIDPYARYCRPGGVEPIGISLI